MTEVHDWDDEDDDGWVPVVDTVPSPPRTPPSPPPIGFRCERCSTVVPTGMADCPRCLAPVGPPRRGAGRPGGVLRLAFRGGGRHLDVPRGSEIRLGRDDSWAPEASEFLADEDTVSGRHATVVHTSDGAAWLTEVPQGATNGTRVNDRVLAPGSRVRLSNGDRVELGPEVDFEVRGIGEEPEEAAP
ncbi:FHA domain-containing protein [Streptomyces diastatochromogenes]|uniref:FHA domain-containing protein n=1 Tax=Streptomyces diastatochromogenes TaxID=42236 RepID=UPI001FCA1DD9|nr:FHA domain-containing protein [Streptomyces diastatochromogenes]